MEMSRVSFYVCGTGTLSCRCTCNRCKFIWVYGMLCCLVWVPFSVCHLDKIYAFIRNFVCALCICAYLSPSRNGLWCALSSKMEIEFGCTSCILITENRRIKEQSFKIATRNSNAWMQFGLPILFRTTYTRNDNIYINSKTSTIAPPPISNASFIHSTSELNFPFTLKFTNIESDFAIDTSTQKRQFTHGIVCFWCINNFPHARFTRICCRTLSNSLSRHCFWWMPNIS